MRWRASRPENGGIQEIGGMSPTETCTSSGADHALPYSAHQLVRARNGLGCQCVRYECREEVLCRRNAIVSGKLEKAKQSEEWSGRKRCCERWSCRMSSAGRAHTIDRSSALALA